MSKHYSPKGYLRLAPHTLLRDYFHKRGIDAEIDWEDKRKTNAESIFQVIESQSSQVSKEIEADFRQVLSMADEGGTLALIDEAGIQNISEDLAERLGSMEGHLERAFWVFLNHPEVFYVAQRIDRAMGFTFNGKRMGLPELLDLPDEKMVRQLEQAISASYRESEGRGQGCQIDHYERGDVHYWFALLANYAESRPIYDDDDKLDVKSQRPAFELVFVHNTRDRTLEIHGASGKRRLLKLQRVFGRVVLGVELGEPGAKEVIYALDRLLDRDFAFETDLQDGIESVRLKKLKFHVIGNESTITTLESSSQSSNNTIADMIDGWVTAMEIPKSVLIVTLGSIEFLFRAGRGKRKRSVVCTMSHPDKCSLKCGPQHEIGKSYLKRWGLDVTGEPDYIPPVPGLNAQYIIRTEEP